MQLKDSPDSGICKAVGDEALKCFLELLSDPHATPRRVFYMERCVANVQNNTCMYVCVSVCSTATARCCGCRSDV